MFVTAKAKPSFFFPPGHILMLLLLWMELRMLENKREQVGWGSRYI